MEPTVVNFFTEKSLPYWIALVGSSFESARQSKIKSSFLEKATSCGISIVLGRAVSEPVAEWSGLNEILVVVVLGSFGLGILRVIRASVIESDILVDVIKSYLGKKGEK